MKTLKAHHIKVTEKNATKCSDTMYAVEASGLLIHPLAVYKAIPTTLGNKLDFVLTDYDQDADCWNYKQTNGTLTLCVLND